MGLREYYLQDYASPTEQSNRSYTQMEQVANSKVPVAEIFKEFLPESPHKDRRNFDY